MARTWFSNFGCAGLTDATCSWPHTKHDWLDSSIWASNMQYLGETTDCMTTWLTIEEQSALACCVIVGQDRSLWVLFRAVRCCRNKGLLFFSSPALSPSTSSVLCGHCLLPRRPPSALNHSPTCDLPFFDVQQHLVAGGQRLQCDHPTSISSL